ncbi:MAG: DNA/RNA non-specific endonuclease [Rikenellaceae bacterium]
MKILNLSLFLICSIFSTVAQNYLPRSSGEVIKHTYYTLSYCEQHEQAEWVYYQITPSSLTGGASRSDNFRRDDKVSTGSAELSDYASSGYDRGHLCPAASMSFNSTAMSESFYLSNMSPQVPAFNRGAWKKLEECVRNFAAADSVIHVVTGPLFNTTLGTIGSNKVTIPEYYYKVVYSPKKGEMIGFVMHNSKLDGALTSYAQSVDHIEELSGIDFFADIDDSLSQQEARVNLSAWPFDEVTSTTSSAPAKIEAETSQQCKGITSSKSRCKNQTKNSNGYCHLHQSQAKE